ncbi:hypothetical protein Dimus_014853 [Dionaea muscipula]
MWSLPNTIGKIRLRKVSTEPNLSVSELSDDDPGSSPGRDEVLECPVCWESFNLVENVPYVLWCGHTLCQNCVLGLQWATVRVSTQKLRIPFFISCPWCSLLSFRLVYRGHLRFPRKNYFILWMVESMNGDRVQSHPSSSLRGDNQNQLVWSPRRSSLHGNHGSCHSPRMAQHIQSRAHLASNSTDDRSATTYVSVERPLLSLYKSLDILIHLASKFPFVITFLVIVFLAIPGSLAIMVLYLLITILFALPSFLNLYFAYPALNWLMREITN